MDVRIIAATNVNLEEAVQRARFREDLFYRLRVLLLDLPPLREREGDIQLLAQFYVDSFNREFRKGMQEISGEALRRLNGYVWPGNVRELRNAVERAMLLTENGHLDLDDFPTFKPAER